MVKAKLMQMCPVARAMNILGERWTVLLLRDLFMYGPRRFQDFTSSLEGISPTTLSARLKRLEETQLVERHYIEDETSGTKYVLTPKGRDLEPVLKALLAWGQKHTSPDV